MSDDDTTRYSGPNHTGEARSAPYGLSRMAPAIDLVDVAREIQKADALVSAVASEKLATIADQIRALQAQAQEVLAKAQRDAMLHRAECRFVKVPGQVYHLYRRDDDTRYFSMLSPDDWRGKPPHAHEGSYRVEADLSFTSLEEAAVRDAKMQGARRLLGGG